MMQREESLWIVAVLQGVRLYVMAVIISVKTGAEV
jgi:hypothetical protein